MGKNNLAREGTNRGSTSIRGRTRGIASGRGPSTSKSILAARDSPLSTLTARDASPIRNTVVTRGGLSNRGKGKDPLLRTKDDNIEKIASKKSEKKIYKVSLTNAVVKKLIAAKSKGTHMKISASDKMEIHTGEGEKIQLDLSSPKKTEMIFIRNNDIVEPVGNVIEYTSTTTKLHEVAKRDLVVKKLRESYEKETKGKRRVQVIEYPPPEQEIKMKSKRQKNNAGSSIKVQQSPSMNFLQVPSSKVSLQLSNSARGGKSVRGKARGGRTRVAVNTAVTTEVADVDDITESTITARGGNMTRSSKISGSGKSTRGRGAKTLISDAPKVNAPTAQSTTSTRGKRGRPAGVTNKTTRGAKTYTPMTTRTSAALKTSAIVKNDNEQLSMSEGTTSSSSKKGKSKANGQQASSEWKPGQTITILTDFKQARKICEKMENDIQEVIEDLGAYENLYNTYANSIKNVKGSAHDLLRDIEKQFGEGSPADKLMQRYFQLEKDIRIIHDELWRAAREGVYED
ncbi:hypothetical protein C1645_828666 [Glomus cerebriforme]|uniref:Uncharacterized protein n=1 Tax=Glomus cerebriforme TaxID=658196 RepID=A0A397SPJ3_9GLOM|nr:hypothetical protein C1645_828666 [Glomus cerebriforme]